jgi:hypothetical protein
MACRLQMGSASGLAKCRPERRLNGHDGTKNTNDHDDVAGLERVVSDGDNPRAEQTGFDRWRGLLQLW